MRFTPHANIVCRADNRHYQHEGKARLDRAVVREYKRMFFSGEFTARVGQVSYFPIAYTSEGYVKRYPVTCTLLKKQSY